MTPPTPARSRYTLTQLQGLKRAQLQSLCKENKLKANGKTSELVISLATFWHLSTESYLPTTISKPPPSKKSSSSSFSLTGSGSNKANNNNNKATEILPPVPVLTTGRVARVGEGDDDEDEMGMSFPIANHQTFKKKPLTLMGGSSSGVMGVKKSGSGMGMGVPIGIGGVKKRIGSGASTACAASASVSGAGAGAGAGAGSEEAHRAGYTTSPATKATIATLLSTVSSLQSDLALTRTSLDQKLSSFQSTISHQATSSLPPGTPKAMKNKLQDEIMKLVRTELDELKVGILRRVEGLEDGGEEYERRRKVERVCEEGFEELKKKVEGLTEDFGSRLNKLEGRSRQNATTTYSPSPLMESEVAQSEDIQSAVAVAEDEAAEEDALPDPEPQTDEPEVENLEEEIGDAPISEQEREFHAAVNSSPAFSDAPPPVASLATFSSPLVPTPIRMSTSRSTSASASTTPSGAHSPLPRRISTPSSRRSPRRSIIPAHVYQPSPKLTPTASPKAPLSPAAPILRSLGKRGRRDSDASLADESSVVAVRSPPFGSNAIGTLMGQAQSNIFGVISPTRSGDEGHARKRIRMSDGGALEKARAELQGGEAPSEVDEEVEEEESLVEAAAGEDVGQDQAEEVEDEEEEREYEGGDSLVEHQEAQEQSFASTSSSEEEGDNSLESVHDYLVQTKLATPTPATSDPSFFATKSLSAQSARVTSLASSENVHPGGGRKSLPLSALPFPIVSPFKVATNTVPASSSTTNFLTSASTSSIFTLNRLPPNKSPVKSRRQSLRLSSPIKSAPPTPRASGTLYGTEDTNDRFADDSIIGGGDGEDDGEEVGGTLRRQLWRSWA